MSDIQAIKILFIKLFGVFPHHRIRPSVRPSVRTSVPVVWMTDDLMMSARNHDNQMIC